ncbi:hypothetical protein [Mycolicibacterium sediminis]|uniref:DUF1622 domain-containing protein n=1 Tax=Mycolicibacterium sediminis TaxID=1286180 RepID=A0A7I7QTA5_9MYCO|nr:hypothetical protein [Mycolicibacterium sediminis]BBY29455.1 hypothetical protein MSEDJ_35510 [Mycolicibacterium sediminis]
MIAVSWLVAAAAILLAGVTLAVFGRPILALHVLLDLFLAAGLLRLSADASWATIAVTAGVVVLRQVVTRGLVAADSARAPSAQARVAR